MPNLLQAPAEFTAKTSSPFVQANVNLICQHIDKNYISGSLGSLVKGQILGFDVHLAPAPGVRIDRFNGRLSLAKSSNHSQLVQGLFVAPRAGKPKPKQDDCRSSILEDTNVIGSTFLRFDRVLVNECSGTHGNGPMVLLLHLKIEFTCYSPNGVLSGSSVELHLTSVPFKVYARAIDAPILDNPVGQVVITPAVVAPPPPPPTAVALLQPKPISTVAAAPSVPNRKRPITEISKSHITMPTTASVPTPSPPLTGGENEALQHNMWLQFSMMQNELAWYKQLEALVMEGCPHLLQMLPPNPSAAAATVAFQPQPQPHAISSTPNPNPNLDPLLDLSTSISTPIDKSPKSPAKKLPKMVAEKAPLLPLNDFEYGLTEESGFMNTNVSFDEMTLMPFFDGMLAPEDECDNSWQQYLND